jgi:hypothetical protein
MVGLPIAADYLTVLKHEGAAPWCLDRSGLKILRISLIFRDARR